MTIIELLEKNSENYGSEEALVEINPEKDDSKKFTWKESELIENTESVGYRRSLTWEVFNEKANRMANMLLSKGAKKGDKVGILLMNCLEWLPIYFGILKAGCIAVPLNFRYSSDEILYCSQLADIDLLLFGPTFITRIDDIVSQILNG